MNQSPTVPTVSLSKANPGPMQPRGLGRVIPGIVGWALVLGALAAAAWARSQPAEWSAGRIALVFVVLIAMAGGTALAGRK